MKLYGRPFQPSSPEDKIAPTQGWTLRNMSTGKQVLTVSSDSGQLLLKDPDEKVRWSLAVRDGGTKEFLFVDGDPVPVKIGDGQPGSDSGPTVKEFTLSLRKKAESSPEGQATVTVLELLKAATTGTEILDVSVRR